MNEKLLAKQKKPEKRYKKREKEAMEMADVARNMALFVGWEQSPVTNLEYN